MPGLGNDGPGAAGNAVLPLMLRDGRNSAPGLNAVGGVVAAEAMKAPRFVALICHSGPCGVPTMPVVCRVGAITEAPVAPPPPALTGTAEVMKVVSEKVGGKWNVPSVSTVRDDNGAWLLLKYAVVRARLTAMLSSSWMVLLALLATPRISPVRSTTATWRNGLSVAASARVRIVDTSPAVSGCTSPKNGSVGVEVPEPPLQEPNDNVITAANPAHTPDATRQNVKLRRVRDMATRS